MNRAGFAGGVLFKSGRDSGLISRGAITRLCLGDRQKKFVEISGKFAPLLPVHRATSVGGSIFSRSSPMASGVFERIAVLSPHARWV
jgi:hypothetical protein